MSSAVKKMVEQAAEGSRELDAAVWLAIFEPKCQRYDVEFHTQPSTRFATHTANRLARPKRSRPATMEGVSKMGDEAAKLSRIGAALYEDAPMKKMVRMSGGFDWPRRASLEHMTPAEVAIRNAVIEVEKVGAHPDLTAIVTGLGDMQDKLADYIDAQPDSPPTTIAPTGNVEGEHDG